MQYIEGGVTAAKGFLAGGVHCGIRKNKSKRDLALIYSEKPCAAAGVYTQNLVKGAPILVTQKNLADGRAQIFRLAAPERHIHVQLPAKCAKGLNFLVHHAVEKNGG